MALMLCVQHQIFIFLQLECCAKSISVEAPNLFEANLILQSKNKASYGDLRFLSNLSGLKRMMLGISWEKVSWSFYLFIYFYFPLIFTMLLCKAVNEWYFLFLIVVILTFTCRKITHLNEVGFFRADQIFLAPLASQSVVVASSISCYNLKSHCRFLQMFHFELYLLQRK